MTNEDKIANKKIKEGKKAAKGAETKKLKNKMNAAAQQVMTEMAASLPAGGANLFKVSTQKILAIREKKKILAAEERAVFAQLKEAKINITCYKINLRWVQMEPGDVKSEKATCALYAEQMEMELSPTEKAAVSEINKKREDARKIILEGNGGDAGKEVGSSVMKKTEQKASPEASASVPEETRPAIINALPERNERIGAGFRTPGSVALVAGASTATH